MRPSSTFSMEKAETYCKGKKKGVTSANARARKGEKGAQPFSERFAAEFAEARVGASQAPAAAGLRARAVHPSSVALVLQRLRGPRGHPDAHARGEPPAASLRESSRLPAAGTWRIVLPSKDRIEIMK